MITNSTENATPECEACHKAADLCVCAAVAPLDNSVQVLILQHPQEQDKELGTAWLLHRMLNNSAFKVGLSWPSLHRILGREVDMKRWGVLYLGTVAKGGTGTPEPVAVVDRNGVPLPEQDSVLGDLDGLIVLDGSWEQAKTLWWRNAWLLKARRIVLNPDRPSLYGTLRREPRKASLSTLEATAFALSHLEQKPDLYEQLTSPMRTLLDVYRAKYPNPPAQEQRRSNRHRSKRRQPRRRTT